MKNLFPALLAMAFLFAGAACSVPPEPTGSVTNFNTTILAGIDDLDRDGYVDEIGFSGTLPEYITEICTQAAPGTELECFRQVSAALRGLHDCDFDRTDDPAECPRVGTLDCTNPTFSGCAPCVHPMAEEVIDGFDNNCDGALGPNECGDVSDCDGGDVCNAAVCGSDHLCATQAVVCDDNETCTTDSCNPASGCVFTPTEGCCTTDLNCADDEVCSGAGSCEPVPCQDDDLTDCLAPVAMNHQCLVQNVANGMTCDDANACSTGETCTDGVCGDGATPSCDDENACTTDSCDLATGCAHTALSCDDGEACTTDSCNPTLGCVYTPTQGCCTTDQNCADDEVCSAGSCEPVPCTDSDLTDCVAPVAQNHQCVVVNVANGSACLDNNACTTGETCTAGVCGNGATLSCNDSNACTTDSCNPATGCGHAPVTCNDNNACTTDSCSPATGCGFAPILGCDADCNPRNDRLGEDVGDCAPYRPTFVTLPAHYGWGCIPTGLVFEPLLPETGTCGPYEDADNDEFADDPEQYCSDNIDGNLDGVTDNGPVCNPVCVNAAGCDDADPCTTDACTTGVCVHTQIDGCCTSNGDCADGEYCNDAELGQCVELPLGEGIIMTWTRKESTEWDALSVNLGTCTDRIGTISVSPDGVTVTVTFLQDPDACRMGYKLDNGAGGVIFDPGCWGTGGSKPTANNPDSDGDGIGDACAPQFLGDTTLNCNGVAGTTGYSPNLMGDGVDYRPDCTPPPPAQ